jgi:hypothetical protein
MIEVKTRELIHSIAMNLTGKIKDGRNVGISKDKISIKIIDNDNDEFLITVEKIS